MYAYIYLCSSDVLKRFIGDFMDGILPQLDLMSSNVPVVGWAGEQVPRAHRIAAGAVMRFWFMPQQGHKRWDMTGWWVGTFFIFPYIGNVLIPID